MIETYFLVRCDRCGCTADLAAKESTALMRASRLGWRLNVEDTEKDWCPRCALPANAEGAS